MNTQQNNLLKKSDVITALKNIGMTVPSDITESLNNSDYVTYDTLSFIIRTTAQYHNQDFNKLYELTVKKIKELNNNERATNDSTLLSTNENYEHVNHPSHYNNYGVEVIDMMESIWGTQNLITFCEMNAFKYRMRMGTKPDNSIEQDIQKEQWYLNKAHELKDKLIKTKVSEFFDKE
ncbi:DUF3310 domain-containing protein [Methanosphaera sp.]|uniref:DUF3310 domain-containing protein n=1 Tax=Methanosphaera sp. TaxID=2666342 RepID=UPI0025DB72FE|nr:DUF3310 domain-containing protein [Methanosphaera sp.]